VAFVCNRFFPWRSGDVRRCARSRRSPEHTSSRLSHIRPGSGRLRVPAGKRLIPPRTPAELREKICERASVTTSRTVCSRGETKT
jgi:hypothetical protein